MTIIVILAGFLISHFASAVGRVRSHQWLLWPVDALRQRFGEYDWVALAAVIAVSLVVGVGGAALVTWLAGWAGWMLLALAAVIYTLGPRDLDRDVDCILADPGHADAREAAAALGMSENSGSVEAGAAVFHSACERWFAILFWFVLLGIPGALLYRLCEQALRSPSLAPGEIDWLARLRWVMEWPVLALMLVSLGLVADFDRVYQAWKRYHADRAAWLLSPPVFRAIAAELIEESSAAAVGLRLGRRLIWRMLVLWLVVMSLMLLAGWLV